MTDRAKNKENLSEQAVKDAFLKQIDLEFDRISDIVEKIKDESTPVWVQDKLYEKLKLDYTPSLHNSVTILKFCSVESIKNNYDNLFRFYCDENSLMKESAEEIIREALGYSMDDIKDTSEYNKEMFATMWYNGKELNIGDKTVKIPDDKSGYYCVYFSENHTVEDILWFLQNRLKKIVKTNAEMKHSNKKTEALLGVCFIGYLTILGMRPIDIYNFCRYYFGDEKPFDEYRYINKVRYRLKRNDWFHEANEEFTKIISTEKANKILNNYTAKMSSLLDDWQNNNRNNNELASMTAPRFLELSFSDNNGKPLFHIKMQ